MVGATTENNMADQITPEMQDISRQRDLAKLLLQKGLTDNLQGQMVSGRFVGASPWEGIAKVYSAYKGGQMLKEADKKQLELANLLRQQGVVESQDILSTMRGREAVPEVIPQGQTLLDDQGMPTYGAQKAVAGVAPDLQSAYAKAIGSRSPQAQALAPLLAKQLMREPKYQEINIVNDKTGNTETYRYDANSPDPKSTMQLLGVNKPALSRAEQIRFADENINTNIGGGNAPVVSPTGGVVPPSVNAPAGGASQTSATVKPTDYNYFKAPPPPAGLSGKQTRDFISEQNKPLTGKANDTVNGAIGYQKSLDKLVDLFNQYKGADMLNPNVKAEFKGALRTAQLQGKEAFGLGVLNGPDLEILEQVLADPTAFDSFLKDRATLNKLYNNQREFTSDAIKTNYRSAQKAVPENLRTYVEIKPIKLKTETKPKTSTKAPKAMFNGQTIVVKDGKWVYESTGKAVE